MKKSKTSIRLLATASVVVVSLGCIIGCGNDETTDSPTELQPIPLISPENTWARLNLALIDQDTDDWLGVISAGFKYVPDPVALDQHAGALTNWDYSAEQEFMMALCSSGMELGVNLLCNDSVPPDQPSASVTWEEVEYSIVVSGDNWSNPAVYRGFATLEFRLEGNFWYLLEWRDLRGGRASWDASVELPTAGALRAVFAGDRK